MWGVSYWIFPVISGLCWLGMLMGLLIHWNVDGKPHYASMDETQTIAYISDVGAQSLKPLFIAGSVVTTVFLDLSFLSERFLRHQGRLARNTNFRQHRILRISFWIKLFFILIEIALAIAFGVCSRTERYNPAAVLEWAIAFVFTFYVFSFFIDLLPAVRTKRHEQRFGKDGEPLGQHFGTGPNETAMQMEQNDGMSNMRDSQQTMVGEDTRTVNNVTYKTREGVPIGSNF
ncbi:putative protein SFK1 [Glarea lozoyensis 74030]|uniref:CWH43-like N-terminal domain-containing protein n=1 Tax=Glarea lozoyensis (strain ATCC 74030 / MF5533) TaxID=1104152 RepID=H0ENI6_GLAL7|nr:putative protein SFK1 [Glarea lozoyensis 74030]